jgi:hypothetical protein
MVPATPDERKCMVDARRPNEAAAKIVPIATNSAEPPWTSIQ